MLYRTSLIFFEFEKKKKTKDVKESFYNKVVSRNVAFASLSNEDKFMHVMKFENFSLDYKVTVSHSLVSVS